MLLHDKFWLNDMSILYQSDRLTDFFPTTKMNLAEKLNSIFRLSVYIGLLN